MNKKNITAVITLVSKNKEYYLKHNEIITRLLEKYKVDNIKTNMLSNLVKDFLINVENTIYKLIKIELNSLVFTGSDLCIQNSLFRKNYGL